MEHPEMQPRPRTQKGIVAFPQIRILLIEEAADCELVRLVLEDARMKVECASSLEEAQSAVAAESIDLIVVGWNREGIDGRPIVHELCKRLPSVAKIPVIVLADHNPSGTTQFSILRLNVHCVLRKPIVPTSLPRLIKRTLNEASSRQHLSPMLRVIQQVGSGQSASGALFNAVN